MEIHKHVFVLLFLLLIIFNSTKASLTYAYYELDPIGFIENLCENKDKPELQCNGKCQLMKVAESQNSDQNTPESIIDFKELILYLSPNTSFQLTQYTPIRRQYFSSHYLNLYTFNNTNDCFHPPRV
ncbi:hypothetical protein [Winogradskyella thalassocola]|uniref:Uncharacterized protein n=1 Tax=Winogradskyella thalassocola TaxID=262004 RepID=A0A1G8LBM8_9FLAO|nr:hypothetical protein [Winogradskyella thalassocola]SDI53104.1 hypothetical protein SAMN04489796_11287 [Winogradskyella thalassocola]